MSKDRETVPAIQRAPRMQGIHARDNPWGVTLAEAQVLDLMCEGLLHKQIADRLGIERKTVEAAASSARRRMGYRGHSIVPYLVWDRWRMGRTESQEG